MSALQDIIRKAVEPLPGIPSDQAERVAVAVEFALIEATGGDSHIVKVTELDWTLQHPLHERIDGSLFDCKFHPLVKHLVWKERFPVGRIRVWEDRGAILWEEVET